MLRYKTHYNLKDCITLLRGKNIYDVFNYRFEYKNQDTEAFIIFTKCNTHWCNSIHTKYSIKFVQEDNATIIDLCFLNEWWILPLPCIYDKWVDEFMFQKMDAVRI
jgi:hypothetical protein